MKKKILIMIMSCNQKIFMDQLNIVRSTWLKNVIDNKYENIDYCIYSGQNIPKHKYIKDTHELILRCEDDVNNTFKKTYYAFKIINKIFKDYDYVFRTNTSTYVNVELLNAFVQKIENNDIVYGSDLYSLSNVSCPYPLDIYVRGNGLLLSRKIIENIIIREGISYLYYEKLDDVVIGNILNSYWIKQNKNYLDYIRGICHGWYKCTDIKVNSRHKICSSYNNDNLDWEYLQNLITLQIKIYGYQGQHYSGDSKRFEEYENENYKELHNAFSLNEYIDIDKAVQKNIDYSINPSIFIGSILGYLTLDEWKNTNKLQLYNLQVNNKASDDKCKNNENKIWM